MNKLFHKRIFAFFMIISFLATALPLTALADAVFSLTEWSVSESAFANVSSFRIGREDARSHFFPFKTEEDAIASQQPNVERDLSKSWYKSLDTAAGQTWKFYHVSNPAARASRPNNASIMNSDYDDSAWDTIDVPKSWQVSYNDDGTFRYDSPQYSNVTYPWVNQTPNPSRSNAPTQFNPVGFYRTSFTVPASFAGRSVFLNFEGVESACYVWVNGHKVGYSQDSFTSKEFKIDEYLNFGGDNTLAVEVFRWSSGSWLEDQDMLRLAGIFRSVYLISKDDVELRDFTIVPKKIGTGTNPATDYTDFDLDIYASIRDLGAASKDGLKVEATLYDPNGAKVPSGQMENIDLSTSLSDADFGAGASKDFLGRAFKTVKLSVRVKAPSIWSAETPNLYKAVITLRDSSDNIIETTAYRFGFRVIEIKNKNTSTAQVIINGQPIMFKGVNIHEMDPDSGRALSFETIRKDVTLMKQNNINAIRMAHYSHDFRYYDAADELGLYVMDETNLETHGDRGIPASNANYRPAVLDRLSSMFYRSKNFPSVVMLSLGNEAGSGNTFAYMNSWLKGTYVGSPSFYVDPLLKGDLQMRPTHYEGDNANADVKSNMYPAIASIPSEANVNKPYVVCEYSHAMGNSNGNMQGFWDAFESRPNIAGGFIWDWTDQTIRTYLKSGYASPQIGTNAYRVRSQDGNQIITYLTGGATALNSVGATGGVSDKALTGVAYTDPTPEELNLNGSFTLEARIRPTSNGLQTIVGKGDSQFDLKANNGTIQFNTYKDGWNSLEFNYPTGTWLNTWHHIVATYDAPTKTAKIYYDNMTAPAASAVFSNANPDGTFSFSGSNFSIGRNSDKGSERDWTGRIDNVRVYNQALTASQFGATRAATDAGVVFWQDFDSAPFNDATAEKPIVSGGYYGYGGDWGDSPNDGNFSNNGIVSADRIPRGSMTEIKRVQQDYVMKLVDFSSTSVKFNIRSRALFTNASAYDFKWELTESGAVIRSGSGSQDIAPLASKDVSINFAAITPKAGKEYALNVKFLTKTASAWAAAGHEISAEQLELSYDADMLPVTDISVLPDFAYSEDAGEYTITGNDFSILFDRDEGTISSFMYKGTELFAQGPEPNYWRAPTDNDRLSSKLRESPAVWRDAGANRSVTSTNIEAIGTKVLKITVSGDLAPTRGNASYSTVFTVYSDGQVVVDQQMTPTGFFSSDMMFAVGNLFQMPDGFENLTWYGRGSDIEGLFSESYTDRKSKQFAGVYAETVDEQFRPYEKVQTFGNKADVRWVAVTNDSGRGLVASAVGDLLQFNAQHVTPEEMTTYGSKHMYEVTKTQNTVLTLDYKQIGVGYDPSWLDKGQFPESEMLRPNKSYQYSYKLSPVDGFDEEKGSAIFEDVRSFDAVSELLVDGKPIDGFDRNKTDYTVYLPADTMAVPVLTALATGSNVDCQIVQAQAIGDTATVTASVNGVGESYTVTFERIRKSFYLDEMNYQSAVTGAGSARKAVSHDGNPITVWKDGKYQVFKHGMSAHADSTLVYNIAGKGYNTFSSYVNLDREVYQSSASCPGVSFSVYVDGVCKYTSDYIVKDGYGTPVESPFVLVNVTGASEVRLVVTSQVNINNAHTDWADAKFGIAGGLGDVDDNGLVASDDALAALKAAVGLTTLSPPEKYRANVSFSGTVSAFDALQILQYSVGKIYEF